MTADVIAVLLGALIVTAALLGITVVGGNDQLRQLRRELASETRARKAAEAHAHVLQRRLDMRVIPTQRPAGEA